MSRYIDAVKTAEIVSERHKIPLSELVDTFAKVPPADVKEVKHGEWITDKDGFVICSECGEEHTWDDFRPTFCDMCGARMDDGRLKNDYGRSN